MSDGERIAILEQQVKELEATLNAAAEATQPLFFDNPSVDEILTFFRRYAELKQTMSITLPNLTDDELEHWQTPIWK